MKNRRNVHLRSLSVRELAAVALMEHLPFDMLLGRVLSVPADREASHDAA